MKAVIRIMILGGEKGCMLGMQKSSLKKISETLFDFVWMQ
jgi:hypothetical protein